MGHLNVNGTETTVHDAECDLFCGRLGVDASISCGDLGIYNIPFPSAVKFDQLSGESYSCADCTKEVYETTFTPSVRFRNTHCAIRSIKLDSLNYSNGIINFAIDLYAVGTESDTLLSVNGEVRAECSPIHSLTLLSGVRGPMPIRFAEYYMPIIGLPGIKEGTSLSDLTKIFGQPHHCGGGLHPQYGRIPQWIRYTLQNCYLRFQFENEIVTEVFVMSIDDPPCDLLRTL